MGTRNLICAVIDGDFKVAQYSQWDGYPSGQGAVLVAIMQSIMDFNELDAFKAKVRDCSFVPAEQCTRSPEFSRDTGSKILALIREHGAMKLYNSADFGADSLVCEYAYVVDLDREVLEFYEGFYQGTVEDNRFAQFAKGGKYAPVRLAAEFPLEGLEGAVSSMETASQFSTWTRHGDDYCNPPAGGLPTEAEVNELRRLGFHLAADRVPAWEHGLELIRVAAS